VTLKAIILLLFLPHLGLALDRQADSLKIAANEPEPTKPQVDLSIWLGNESNQADGIWGPITYGLIGNYTFENEMAIEATFVRMHEPGMRTFDSFLDEGQLAIRMPPIGSLSLDATLWRNRMMEMYTTVGGAEITNDVKTIALNAGLYAGTASREEVSGRFLGAILGVTKSFGPVEASLSHFAGLIHTPGDPSGLGKGKYHKSSLEATMPIGTPVTASLAVERRYFDFGNGGPVSEAIDTYILIVGAEINLTDLFAK
jgi:hypothetical protein